MQDVHSTYPTQETCARACILHGSHPTRELNHTYHTRSGIDYLSALKYLDHSVGIDNLRRYL